MARYSIEKCPSCGGPGKLREKNRTVINGNTVRNCYVFCKRCDFRGPRVLYQDYSESHMAEMVAIEKWNRRV